MKIGFNPLGMEQWVGNDGVRALELIAHADRRGVDSIILGEHILMGTRDLDNYPYRDPGMTKKLFDERTTFYESLIRLSAIAAVTKHMRLTTGILLSPLRTATLLAKQVATLDHLSGGRVDLGVGVGWQKFEYDAESLPWEGRFGRMTEIAKACKILWTQAPASFHGKHVNFDDVYSLPFPVQKGGVPQWFAVAPTDRNIERMAEIADGWAPLGVQPDVVAATMQKVRARMDALGRDPAKFGLRLYLTPVYTDGKPDFDTALKGIPKLLDLGATHIDVLVATYCGCLDDYEPFLDKFISARQQYRRV